MQTGTKRAQKLHQILNLFVMYQHCKYVKGLVQFLCPVNYIDTMLNETKNVKNSRDISIAETIKNIKLIIENNVLAINKLA